MKRTVDIVLAALLIVLLSPIGLLLVLMIRVESPGPALVRSHRVGRHGRMVKVWEFRTAIADPEAMETVGGCEGEQVTRLGPALRRTGIAQWPWLWTVLRGDFSIVGPRAEMPRYVGVYPTELRKLVLSVKPGLIDFSSIECAGDAQRLTGLDRDEQEALYVEKIMPRRLDCAKRYVENRGFFTDLKIIAGFIRGKLSLKQH